MKEQSPGPCTKRLRQISDGGWLAGLTEATLFASSRPCQLFASRHHVHPLALFPPSLGCLIDPPGRRALLQGLLLSPAM